MKRNSSFRFLGALVCAGVLHVSAAAAATETVIYAFKGDRDGASPDAPLIWDGRTLYGTTIYGGGLGCSSDLGCGTVFSLKLNGTETVLHRFGRGLDGIYPVNGLINVNGTFYGTTYQGGNYYGTGCGKRYRQLCGTVFSITPDGTETVLHTFALNAVNGGLGPSARLIQFNGTLYGTTSAGGASNNGTVFSITPSGQEKVLYSFRGGDDGASPNTRLIAINGALYGTTAGGRNVCDQYHSCGTIFSVTPSGSEKVVYAFQGGGDGYYPAGSLINMNGVLYGTTVDGGIVCEQDNVTCGTVFSITPSGTEKVVYAFKGGKDGAHPFGGLIFANGRLYGTTGNGGGTSCFVGSGCGTVFSVTPNGTEKVLYAFKAGTDGAVPVGDLIDIDGTLYGVTNVGGPHGSNGTVFSIKP
jgi:uncharacterized repeat protein (TIGR03803 family)